MLGFDMQGSAEHLLRHDENKIGLAPGPRPKRSFLLDNYCESGILAYLQASREINDFKLRIHSLLIPLGVDVFAHHGITWASALDIFGTYPDEFLAEYIRRQCHREDMMLRFAQSRRNIEKSCLFQHEIEEYVQGSPFISDDIVANKEISKLHWKNQLISSGGIFLDSEEPSHRALFRIASRKMSEQEFHGCVRKNMEKIVKVAYAVDSVGRNKFRTKFHPREHPLIPISNRPIALLAILQKDLTLNEAAKILGISISTANQHIAAAKRAFGTFTTHGTIWAAHKEGFLGKI